MCGVSPTGLAETQRLCELAGLSQELSVTTHIVDVADRTQVERFRDEVADRHQTDKIHLLFNNAGISGGGGMVTNSRDPATGFVHDQLSDGRRFRILAIVDDFTRECLALVADTAAADCEEVRSSRREGRRQNFEETQ
jgi:NAD(P)-dependent dehydrogenase (short-subunit alcohol dehydrogenase family)